MVRDFLSRLMQPDPPELPEQDARSAMAALLVRIARADGAYEQDEVHRIDRILAARYAMTPFEAAALRREAETVEDEAPDTVRFTRAIKTAVPHDDRLAVVTALWQVVLADGRRDEQEDALLRQVAPLLGISDRESNAARKRVEDGA